MALWQFDIEVIPTERVQSSAQVDAAEFDNALWWSDRQPPADFREGLASLLPAVKSWDEGLLWYGDEQSDRIDVWMEGDRVESIGVRIDCRKANVPFVRGLLIMAQDWSCSLVEKRYLKVLPATLEAFVAAVADSPSCRFMEDPGYWLPKLAAEVQAAEGGR
jgi:hypothetical protein